MAFSKGQPAHLKVSAELHGQPLLTVQALFDFPSANQECSARGSNGSNRPQLRNDYGGSCLDSPNAMDVFAFTDAYAPVLAFGPMFQQPISGFQDPLVEPEPFMSFGKNPWDVLDSLDSLLSPIQWEYV